MFLLFQALSKPEQLPSKAQRLPEGGFQLCVGAQLPHLLVTIKGEWTQLESQWQVKLEIHVLCYCNRHRAQWKSPQETSIQYLSVQLFWLSPSAILTEIPNERSQLRAFQGWSAQQWPTWHPGQQRSEDEATAELAAQNLTWHLLGIPRSDGRSCRPWWCQSRSLCWCYLWSPCRGTQAPNAESGNTEWVLEEGQEEKFHSNRKIGHQYFSLFAFRNDDGVSGGGRFPPCSRMGVSVWGEVGMGLGGILDFSREGPLFSHWPIQGAPSSGAPTLPVPSLGSPTAL